MKKLLTMIGLAAATLAGVQGQVLFTGSYAQNFDGFGTGDVTWSNNSTLAGWTIASEAAETILVASTGSTVTGQLYNYGSASNSDRALGYLGSSLNDWTNYYLEIQNSTGTLITEMSISFDGELWRSGGVQPAESNNRFAFYYATGTPALVDSASVAGWTAVTALNYAPIISVAVGSQTGAPTTLSATISGLSLSPGSSLYFRWFGDNGAGIDAGLAIDNVSVIPEPRTFLLIGIGSCFVLWSTRRRRRRDI